MLKRRASLLRFLCILGQAGVLGELGELLTDQNKWVLFLVTFYISPNNGSCMPSRRLRDPAARYPLCIIHIQKTVVQKSAQIINCGGVCYCACSISEMFQ